MLLGRTVEEAQITALLESAQTGRSGALVLRGEAGIGKTALLEAAAATEGFLCLRARGRETEAEIGFSARLVASGLANREIAERYRRILA